jgi:HlyD family secretion protein
VKSWRTWAVLLLCLVSVGTISCVGGGGNGTATTQQLIKVVSGNITATMSGSGNIEASRKLSLSFQSSGRIDKIYVKEGDEVNGGKVLAKLDTSSLELAVNQAQMTVTQAQGTLLQAQLAQSSAQNTLDNLKNSGDSLNLALINAQIARDTAKIALTAGVAAVDFTAADAELNRARSYYAYVQYQVQHVTGNVDIWLLALDRAKQSLDAAQSAYDNALAGYDSNQVNLKKEQLAASELSVTLAQKNINDLGKNVTLQEMQAASANQTVKQAAQSLDLAKQSVAEAQKQLNGAVLTAPFDGIITSVSAEEGDTVTSVAQIIDLMDPTNKELVVDVDETDVIEIKPGQKAIIEVDAFPGLLLEGRISYVSPVARNSAGLMLYKVKMNVGVQDSSRLRVGMSASADIVIMEQVNVLLVPNEAIKRDSLGNKIIRVEVGGKISDRQVVTGISNSLQAEIISGLNEGDTVVE